jgi:hypothetical protein
MKTLHIVLIATASITIAAISSFLMVANYTDNEIISSQTGKTTYHYGEKINLEISDTNLGPKKEISDFKTVYAGDPGPCGEGYFDFVFLRGDFSKISTYDELVTVKNNTLNVVYSTPFNGVMCPIFLRDIKHVTMDAYSNHITIFYGDNSKPDRWEEDLITVYNIDHVYGKQSIYRQTSPTTTEEYVTSQLIPPGKYTAIAFNLAGKISKPNVIIIG